MIDGALMLTDKERRELSISVCGKVSDACLVELNDRGGIDDSTAQMIINIWLRGWTKGWNEGRSDIEEGLD